MNQVNDTYTYPTFYHFSAPEWFDADWISKIKQDISSDNHRLKVCSFRNT